MWALRQGLGFALHCHLLAHSLLEERPLLFMVLQLPLTECLETNRTGIAHTDVTQAKNKHLDTLFKTSQRHLVRALRDPH